MHCFTPLVGVTPLVGFSPMADVTPVVDFTPVVGFTLLVGFTTLFETFHGNFTGISYANKEQARQVLAAYARHMARNLAFTTVRHYMIGYLYRYGSLHRCQADMLKIRTTLL
jgi:hypothetical protein